MFFLTKLSLTFLLMNLLCLPLLAAIKLPAIFCDNMVLQQQTDVSIWGMASSGAQVSVRPSWDGRSVFIKADRNGKWSLKIRTPKFGGPYSLKISDGKEVSLNNVMIGEVWICSGQSNMEMPMIGYNGQPVNGSLDAIVRSRNKNIRLFTVKRAYDIAPLDDCSGNWEEASPQTVERFSATAYFFGKMINEVMDIPIGLISVNWGGSSIKSWMSEASLKPFNLKPENKKESITRPNQSPATLYNGMINPILGYGIRGAIWYQGETDKHLSDQYVKMFDKMVSDWRIKWKVGDFPFYYCQIAPYEHGGKANSAFFREAQGKCMQITPNTGMVVLMDADSPESIHPAKKQEAGNRLAYWALAETYGIKGFVYKSPSVKHVSFEDGKGVVTFNDAPRGLTAYGKEVKGVFIAGEDKKWYRGTVAFNDSKMYVFSPNVIKPVAIRYGFTNYAQAMIFSNQGLPVSSFRTDDWME